MIINLNQGENCQATLTIEIPAEKVTSERDLVTKQFMMHTKVSGYRPGKVPRKLIEKRFEKGIREELEKRIADEAFAEARRKEDLHILKVVSRETTLNVDETYTVTAKLLVAPSFELPDYKGIPISLPKEEVLEEHVEKLIDRWKERNADYKKIEDGALEMGQYGVVDYTASKDGEPLVKEDSPPMYRAFFERKDAWMMMDEGVFLPGFCGELLDHKPGDEFEFKLTLPGDFGEESLAGQEVSYAVTLKKIMRKEMPELTDEMVKGTTNGEFETAEAFKEDLNERLGDEAKQYVDGIRAQKALEYLHGLLDFDLPAPMVDLETQQHVNRIVNDSQQKGVDKEALLEKEQEIVDAAGQMGRRDVKTKFILNEISTAEGLKVNDQEVLMRVQAMAQRANMSPKKAIRIMKENGHLNSIAEEILFGKALDFVKENASVSIDEAQNALDLMWESEESA
ncbi:MAG: trigger factor [Verrucomicrobiales bacterium]|jgi:trigger factor